MTSFEFLPRIAVELADAPRPGRQRSARAPLRRLRALRGLPRPARIPHCAACSRRRSSRRSTTAWCSTPCSPSRSRSAPHCGSCASRCPRRSAPRAPASSTTCRCRSRPCPRFVAEATAAVLAIVPAGRMVAYGHVGDGNLHFNVSVPLGGDGRAFLSRRAGDPRGRARHRAPVPRQHQRRARHRAPEARGARAPQGPRRPRRDAGHQARARPEGHPQSGQGPAGGGPASAITTPGRPGKKSAPPPAIRRRTPDETTWPDDPAIHRRPTCIGGLYEICVGVPDLVEAIAYYERFGCRAGRFGELDASGGACAVRRRLGAALGATAPRQDADHGLVRLMQWERPRQRRPRPRRRTCAASAAAGACGSRRACSTSPTTRVTARDRRAACA